MSESTFPRRELPVLVVDDMASARALLKDMLSELGISRIIEACDGAQALELLKRTAVRLILCDYMMDGMNGLEFLDELKSTHPEQLPPIIFVSALGDVSSVEAALGLGATDYLVKPVSLAKFRRKVEHLLGVQAAVSAQASPA